MNRKAKLSIALLSLLVCSIMVADLSKGILISDQLEVKNGSKVEGKIFLSTAVTTDALFAYATIEVEDYFTTSDTAEDVIQIKLSLEIQSDFYGNYFNYLSNESKVEMTHLILYDDRETFLPLARVYVENGTDSIELNRLGSIKKSELLDVNRTTITYANGTSYVLATIPYDVYTIIDNMLLDFFDWNDIFVMLYGWTLLGISPIANIGDTVNHYLNLGHVVAKPAVTTSTGKTYDTIQVKYQDNTLFGWFEAEEINAFYEIETGFLIKIIEEAKSETIEFVPGDIIWGSGVPFPTVGIVLGLAALGLITYFNRKKK